MAEIKLKIASVVIGSENGGGIGVAPYYADLPDKPSINGKTLSGNKTTKDLGLASSEQVVPSGGTTGQVLTKRSNLSNDVEWAPSSGIIGANAKNLDAGSNATASIDEDHILQLGIPVGLNAVNPFKGWFTTANIPTTGKEGDYCNVSNTSVTPHTVTIYRWSTAQNEFVDTSEVPDTATGETFASSETLQQVAIDDSHLVNPVNTADSTQPVLSRAEDVMQLKAKLEGVTASEVKVQLITSNEGQNVFNGQVYTKGTNPPTTTTNSSYRYIVINVEGYKSVRFLGRLGNSSSIDSGWAFYNETNYDAEATIDADNGFLKDNTGYINYQTYNFDTTLPDANGIKEYVVKVPNGAKYLKTCVKMGGVTLDNFYCYLQSGTSVGEELADKASYSEMEDLWLWKKNLINQDDLLYGGVYVGKNNSTYAHDENGYTTDYPNGIMSNRIVLEDGATYTVSNVNAYETSPYTIDSNCLIYIARFNSEDELLENKSYTGILKKTDSNPSKNTANATFTYTKHRNPETGEIDEAYCRIRLRFNAVSSDTTWNDYKNAQLEVGTEVTELVPYHSEKVFNIAKKSETDNAIAELEAKHDEDIAEIDEKFKFSDYVEIGANGYYQVDNKLLRYAVTSGSMEKTPSNNSVAQHYRLYPVEEGIDYYFSGAIKTKNNWPEYPIVFLPGTTDAIEGYTGSLDKSDALGFGLNRLQYNTLWEYEKKKLTIPEGCNTIAINIWDTATSLSQFKLFKYVEGEYDLGDLNNKIEAKGEKQTLNILVLGHSNAQETMAYVPYIFRNLEVSSNIDVNFGILYLGSSGIANHINNFDYSNNAYDENNPSGTHQESNTGVPITSDYVTMKNNGTSYSYHRFFINDEDWVNGTSYSIKYVLRRNKWDIILMPANEYAAQTHILMQYITDYVSTDHRGEDANAVEPYTVKFGAINFAAMVVKSNGKQWTGNSDKTHGVPYPEDIDDYGKVVWDDPSEGTLQYRWNKGLKGGEDALNNTLYEFVVPAYAAICNALTVDEIKKFGDYAYHVNNTNYVNGVDDTDDSYGYLRAPDGVHLQEGLPCQIVAYTVICKIFELLGMNYEGILGDTTICNDEWIQDKPIPGYNPDENSGPSYTKKYTTKDILSKATTGWSDDDDDVNLQRVFFAQKCAIMAVKNPFEITDMNNFYGKKHPIMFYAPNASRDIESRISIIDDGKPYSAQITANDGYTISSVSVKMNGVDITGTAYSSADHTITINSVTGKVQILVNATEQSN